ncbi:MAG: hypothetical protein KGD65_14260 [Candidatus Lokiarchaeota archaeon]|nr:hypothetical protein [Candidatus Lokiarchaeota archaeon]
MKLWIIYKERIGFSNYIAEMLQDRLEDYIDVSVGNAKKISPSLLVEERLDYLIIGDNISNVIPTIEIQNWLVKYQEISKSNNLIVKALSGFYVMLTDISEQSLWVEFLQNNVKTEILYPPILRLKLNRAEMAIEDGALELLKDYSNDVIKFILNKEKL